MLNRIVAFTEELIALRTIPAHPDQLHRALDLCLSRIQTGRVEHFEHNGYRSILVYNSENRPQRFRVILNGHLDVIPGKDHQYRPEIRGNKLYGVGATDMKANVACIIEVFNQMASRVSYPLALQLVTEEELGGFDGTKHQIESGVRGDFVIAAESTNFDIVNQAKGVIWTTVTAFGKTAHGAYPWRGENAVQKMARFLARLEQEYPTPSEQQWCTTVNVSAIHSPNDAFNKIPDRCDVKLDIRFLPEESKTALDRLRAIIPPDFNLELVAQEPALFVDQTNYFVERLREATQVVRGQPCGLYCAQGSSDARHYTRVGDAGVEFGPVGGGIGGDEEWISIPSLALYCEILCDFLQRVEPPAPR